MTVPSDMFGSDGMTFAPTRQLASNMSRMSQIRGGN